MHNFLRHNTPYTSKNRHTAKHQMQYAKQYGVSIENSKRNEKMASMKELSAIKIKQI